VTRVPGGVDADLELDNRVSASASSRASKATAPGPRDRCRRRGIGAAGAVGQAQLVLGRLAGNLTMRGWYLTNSHFNRPRPTRHILLRHRAGAREWRRLLNRRLPEGIAKSIRFESPQLHQEVGASDGRFRLPGVLRSFNGLAGATAVCGEHLPAGSPLDGQILY
jgi:hypothetical protein